MDPVNNPWQLYCFNCGCSLCSHLCSLSIFMNSDGPGHLINVGGWLICSWCIHTRILNHTVLHKTCHSVHMSTVVTTVVRSSAFSGVGRLSRIGHLQLFSFRTTQTNRANTFCMKQLQTTSSLDSCQYMYIRKNEVWGSHLAKACRIHGS